MSKKYKINEIFYSIQGEGSLVGTPCIFIRFAGCNLSCNFCDTDCSCKMELTADEIIYRTKSLPKVGWFVFTGGEPLLQLDSKLLDKIEEFYGIEEPNICVETNGTVKLNDELNIDLLVMSPKENTDIKIKYVDDLKIVYVGQDIFKYINIIDWNYVYLQPCDINGKTNIEEVLNIIEQNADLLKLSIQVHKLIGIR